MRRLVFALTLCIGCKGGEAGPPAATTSPRPTPRSPERAALDPRISALLADWERAQDSGDFTRYASLYGERFTGVRRSGPRVRSFDRQGWLADRKRMFAKPMAVDFTVGSVSTAGPSVVVLGEQHFQSGSYEDRGPKRLVLSREGDGYRIAREEMLASELAPPPALRARFVVQASEGPALVLLARAPDDAPPTALRGLYAGATSVLLYDADPSALPSEARVFEGEQALQIVGPAGVCSARVVGLRRARVVLPHFGAVASWRGEDPNRPVKPSRDEVRRELEELGPQGYWALELDGACPDTGTPVAVSSAAKVAVAQRDEPTGADADALRKAVAAEPAMRALGAPGSPALKDALSQLTLARYRLGAQALATVDTPVDCSAPIVHVSYALTPALRRESISSEGGLESVQFAADLDGDGALELVGTSAIGFGEWFVTDRAGKALLTLSLPYLDCPC